MHGGFENETPNIPTNSILKLDLIAHVKGNANLLKNLRALFRMHLKMASQEPVLQKVLMVQVIVQTQEHQHLQCKAWVKQI